MQRHGGMILHCGGMPVTFEELGGYELPKETDTYKPVAHQDLVRIAEDRVIRELDYEGPFDWSYAVNKEGRQFFGVCKLSEMMLTDSQCLSMALRGSYDKSMSNAFAFGGTLFVCDNLAFSGSMVTVMRKHTVNVYRDLKRMLNEALEVAYDSAKIEAQRVESWVEYDLTQDQGYEIIGLLRGNGLITPTITNNMFREWQRPAHEEFQERTVFSLYNAATEAIKAVAPGRALNTYSGVHDFFKAEVVENGFKPH